MQSLWGAKSVHGKMGRAVQEELKPRGSAKPTMFRKQTASNGLEAVLTGQAQPCWSQAGLLLEGNEKCECGRGVRVGCGVDIRQASDIIRLVNCFFSKTCRKKM